jgi:hypothetical protein
MRTRIIANLEVNADFFEKKGEYAVACLINTELAAREKEISDKLSGESIYAKKIFELCGKFVGVAEAEAIHFDFSQKKYVMSDALRKAIKMYQENMEIPVTGQLDYVTLKTAARSDIGIYMYKDFSGF